MALSKGAKKLRSLIFEIYGEDVRLVEEQHLGEGLRLDFHLPDYGLGFEYHGRQHEEYVEHFHGDADGFRESQQRDARKIELCLQQGIALVTIWYHQDLTRELVLSASKTALDSFEPMEAPKSKKYQENEVRRAERLERARAIRREKYLWAKRLKKEREP